MKKGQRKIQARGRLPRAEEEKLVGQGIDFMRHELLTLINNFVSMSVLEFFKLQKETEWRLNSLLFVYFQAESARIVKNIKILTGKADLNWTQIACEIGVTPSHLNRMINGKAPAGWDWKKVIRLSLALGIDSRVMLFSDIDKAIDEQQIPKNVE